MKGLITVAVYIIISSFVNASYLHRPNLLIFYTPNNSCKCLEPCGWHIWFFRSIKEFKFWYISERKYCITNHRQLVKLIWCGKKWYYFSSPLKGLAEGNENQHCVIHCFLRIMIVKVCRCKFSQQNGDFLNEFRKLRSKSRPRRFAQWSKIFLNLWRQ